MLTLHRVALRFRHGRELLGQMVGGIERGRAGIGRFLHLGHDVRFSLSALLVGCLECQARLIGLKRARIFLVLPARFLGAAVGAAVHKRRHDAAERRYPDAEKGEVRRVGLGEENAHAAERDDLQA